MLDGFREQAEELIERKAAGIEESSARRAAGDSDFAAVELGRPRVTMAGKAPARRVSARFPGGWKIVVEERLPLVARIVERPE